MRLRVPHRDSASTTSLCAPSVTASRASSAAEVDEETETDAWYRATFTVDNPTTRYRWLLAGGSVGYAWVDGLGLIPLVYRARARGRRELDLVPAGRARARACPARGARRRALETVRRGDAACAARIATLPADGPAFRAAARSLTGPAAPRARYPPQTLDYDSAPNPYRGPATFHTASALTASRRHSIIEPARTERMTSFKIASLPAALVALLVPVAGARDATRERPGEAVARASSAASSRWRHRESASGADRGARRLRRHPRPRRRPEGALHRQGPASGSRDRARHRVPLRRTRAAWLSCSAATSRSAASRRRTASLMPAGVRGTFHGRFVRAARRAPTAAERPTRAGSRERAPRSRRLSTRTRSSRRSRARGDARRARTS